MTGLIIASCVLAFFTAVLLLPVSVRFQYNEKDLLLRFGYGPFRLPVTGEQLLKKMQGSHKPKEKEEKQEKKEKKEKDGKKISEKGESSAEIFLAIVKSLGKLLSKLKKKVKITHIEVNYTAAAPDPCEAALQYGTAWVVLGNVRGALENVFTLQKADFDVQVDYNAKKPALRAVGGASISLGSIVWLALTAFLDIVKSLIKTS